MLVVKNGAPPARVVINLGHGAKAHARVLDAFEIKRVAAETRAELAALRAGEKPQRKWSTIPPWALEAARVSDDAANYLYGWMHAVLTATACVELLEGVEGGDGVDDTGALINRRSLEPSFETFELIFLDGQVETLFKMRTTAVEQVWQKEKNVSASEPNGVGSEASTSATDASPPANPAPAAESETSPTASADPALSAQTPPEPPKANLPGDSLTSGATPAEAG